MSTNPATIEFILERLSTTKAIRAAKMFGEYAIYVNGKVVALVCDDNLFIKMTAAGKDFAGARCREAPAYKGAKNSLLVEPQYIEDQEWLEELVAITAANVPAPVKKNKKNKINKK